MRGFLPGDKITDDKAPGITEDNIEAVTKDPEAEALYDRKYTCPVCSSVFFNKKIKTGKNRLIGQDRDLRSRYEPVDVEKYVIIMCPKCGHAALEECFENVRSVHVSALLQWMTPQSEPADAPVHTYGMAYIRLRSAMKDAMLRNAKPSETGMIALHSAWLLRGFRSSLESQKDAGTPTVTKKIEKLRRSEDMYLVMAEEKLGRAYMTEEFPIFEMDRFTVMYLLAALDHLIGKPDVAVKYLYPVLHEKNIKPTLRIKAEDLKDEIMRSNKQV